MITYCLQKYDFFLIPPKKCLTKLCQAALTFAEIPVNKNKSETTRSVYAHQMSTQRPSVGHRERKNPLQPIESQGIQIIMRKWL